MNNIDLCNWLSQNFQYLDNDMVPRDYMVEIDSIRQKLANLLIDMDVSMHKSRIWFPTAARDFTGAINVLCEEKEDGSISPILFDKGLFKTGCSEHDAPMFNRMPTAEINKKIVTLIINEYKGFAILGEWLKFCWGLPTITLLEAFAKIRNMDLNAAVKLVLDRCNGPLMTLGKHIQEKDGRPLMPKHVASAKKNEYPFLNENLGLIGSVVSHAWRPPIESGEPDNSTMSRERLLPSVAWKIPYTQSKYDPSSIFRIRKGIPLFPYPLPLYHPKRHLSHEKSKCETVFLTDSIELARLNQAAWREHSEPSIEWVSWYGGLDAVEMVDWKPLVEREVYYVLIEHSGHGTKKVYETADLVRRTLHNEGLGDMKFISYLAFEDYSNRPSGIVRNVPVFISENQFISRIQNPSHPKPTEADRPRASCGKPDFLIAPLIPKRSLVLCTGEPGSGKTWFALGMAYHATQSEKIGDCWDVCNSGSVLYVTRETSREVAGLTFADRLVKIHESIYGNDTGFLGIHEYPLTRHTYIMYQLQDFPKRRLNYNFWSSGPDSESEFCKPTDTSSLPRKDPRYMRFYWAQIPATFQVEPNDISRWILGLVREARGRADASEKHVFIVLDDLNHFGDLDLCGEKGDKCRRDATAIFDMLRANNCTIMVVARSRRFWHEQAGRTRGIFSLPADTIIEIEQAPAIKAIDMVANVYIRKCLWLPKPFRRHFLLAYSFGHKAPFEWHLASLRLFPGIQDKEVKRLRKCGLTIKQISQAVAMKEWKVNAILDKAGMTRKRGATIVPPIRSLLW